ncbi:hypothetical protein [Catellatospora vulcania]|uniref:hypothetical protein n=1 Tax=Catellatospora vulcania TaxID=1460450 RepID=UPI0012D46E5B|nr:hypothetical protein [Catellatospora vulcania]
MIPLRPIVRTRVVVLLVLALAAAAQLLTDRGFEPLQVVAPLAGMVVNAYWLIRPNGQATAFTVRTGRSSRRHVRHA